MKYHSSFSFEILMAALIILNELPPPRILDVPWIKN
jgi:hypothetical protein